MQFENKTSPIGRYLMLINRTVRTIVINYTTVIYTVVLNDFNRNLYTLTMKMFTFKYIMLQFFWSKTTSKMQSLIILDLNPILYPVNNIMKIKTWIAFKNW